MPLLGLVDTLAVVPVDDVRRVEVCPPREEILLDRGHLFDVEYVLRPLAHDHPRRTQVGPLLLGDLETGLVDNLANVEVPPTPPLLAVLVGPAVEDLVDEVVVAPAVLEKDDSSARLEQFPHVLERLDRVLVGAETERLDNGVVLEHLWRRRRLRLGRRQLHELLGLADHKLDPLEVRPPLVELVIAHVHHLLRRVQERVAPHGRRVQIVDVSPRTGSHLEHVALAVFHHPLPLALHERHHLLRSDVAIVLIGKLVVEAAQIFRWEDALLETDIDDILDVLRRWIEWTGLRLLLLRHAVILLF